MNCVSRSQIGQNITQLLLPLEESKQWVEHPNQGLGYTRKIEQRVNMDWKGVNVKRSVIVNIRVTEALSDRTQKLEIE